MEWPVAIVRCARCGDRRRDSNTTDACGCGEHETIGIDVVPVEHLERLRHDYDRTEAAYTDMLGRWGEVVTGAQQARAVCEWLASLDKPWMVKERAQVTLPDIISRAAEALGDRS